MKTAKFTLTSTILAAAFGLTLALTTAPALADPVDVDGCHGEHKPCVEPPSDDGGGGPTGLVSAEIIPGGNTFVVDKDEFGLPLGPYVDKDGGVQSDVEPGIQIGLLGNGKNPREITVFFTCDNPELNGVGRIGGTNGCADFFDGSVLKFGDYFEQRAHLFFAARAYEGVTCPEFELSGECLDVFTMGFPGTAEMGFTVAFDEARFLRLDIASNIGGGTSKRPGRCLSVLTDAKRNAFLLEYCNNFADCNVTVKALGTDLDGRNNMWEIMAANDTGLICGSYGPGPDVFIIGVATNVSFEIEVDVLE